MVMILMAAVSMTVQMPCWMAMVGEYGYGVDDQHHVGDCGGCDQDWCTYEAGYGDGD